MAIATPSETIATTRVPARVCTHSSVVENSMVASRSARSMVPSSPPSRCCRNARDTGPSIVNRSQSMPLGKCDFRPIRPIQ
ncbi:hypothetical protein D3C72_1620730 [compost metagenome]